MSQQELLEVNSKMKEYDIPCDSVWLDIEYSDAKRYFTWDAKNFTNPREMLDKIVAA
jgi:alpha-glucosidase (family GH31 glycosyl hydrolase)